MTYIPKQFWLTPAIDAQFFPMPEATSSNGVEIPCNEYFEMAKNWDVIDSVLGGTKSVKDGGELYLPLEPFEKEAAHKRRVQRCSLSPWYKRLSEGVVGTVMRKPITFNGLNDEIEAQLENIDLQGQDVNSFVKVVFADALNYGHSGILIDYPFLDNSISTLAEEKSLGIAPYWVHLKAKNIIGWRHTLVRSRPILSQLRIKEVATIPSGEFGNKSVERIRVFDLVGEDGQVACWWRLYEENEENEDYLLINQGIIPLPYIPFVCVYTGRNGLLESEPPMLEIAHLNIKHYQKEADLDNSLHVASNPKLVLYGYDVMGGNIDVGVDEALVFADSNCRAEWIAPPPTSFDAQERRIAQIEMQMASLGLSAIATQKNVGESAEAKKLDRVQGDSMLATAAQGLQDALDTALKMHVEYMGKNLVITSQVSRDFNVSKMDASEIAAVSNLQQLGQISLPTLLTMLKDGEVLPDEFDIEEEIELINSTGMAENEFPQTLDQTVVETADSTELEEIDDNNVDDAID